MIVRTRKLSDMAMLAALAAGSVPVTLPEPQLNGQWATKLISLETAAIKRVRMVSFQWI